MQAGHVPPRETQRRRKADRKAMAAERWAFHLYPPNSDHMRCSHKITCQHRCGHSLHASVVFRRIVHLVAAYGDLTCNDLAIVSSKPFLQLAMHNDALSGLGAECANVS